MRGADAKDGDGEACSKSPGVIKRFGGFTALDGVDFAVRPGRARSV